MEIAHRKRLARRIIRQAIQDVGADNKTEAEMAAAYIRGPDFKVHCGLAGYPEELLDTLKEAVAGSKVQRHFLCREILRILHHEWD